VAYGGDSSPGHPPDTKSVLLESFKETSKARSGAAMETMIDWEPEAGGRGGLVSFYWLVLLSSILLVFLVLVTLSVLLRRKCSNKSGRKIDTIIIIVESWALQ
jgi:hypothetical protein